MWTDPFQAVWLDVVLSHVCWKQTHEPFLNYFLITWRVPVAWSSWQNRHKVGVYCLHLVLPCQKFCTTTQWGWGIHAGPRPWHGRSEGQIFHGVCGSHVWFEIQPWLWPKIAGIQLDVLVLLVKFLYAMLIHWVQLWLFYGIFCSFINFVIMACIAWGFTLQSFPILMCLFLIDRDIESVLSQINWWIISQRSQWFHLGSGTLPFNSMFSRSRNNR